MDPQAAWEQLLDAYAGGEWDRVEELADGLEAWLQGGGFPPRAVTGDEMGDDWDRALALAGCRFALEKAREVATHDAQ